MFMRFASRRRALPGLLLCAMLASCAKPPPPPPPTIVKAVISAQSNVNPDARNRPSPVTVRIYGLKSRAIYDTTDFFALYEKDKETLGADLVFKEEFQMMPGENKPLDKQLGPEVVYLGVFVAFRDLERAQWRRVVTVVPQKTSGLQVNLDRSSVTVQNQ
jgi:type VI secretion system protein VasD